jgi:sialic acid synthase
MTMEKPVIIAEIGCNHMGNMDIALDMIKIAAQFCDVDVVKFQKRTNKELLSEEEFNRPHPVPSNSYGDTYGEHREFLELSLEQHKKLKAACEEWGIEYSTSVWDLTSAKETVSLDPVLIKIPSAMNTDFVMLNYLAREYRGEIHISLGMTLDDEREQLVNLLEKHDRLKDTVLYHCVSGYPVEDEELFLMEIVKLKKLYDGKAKAIGFSGHHKGIAADVAALTLGAEYFERHFTMDRTWKGTDHAASLEPDGMRRLNRNIKGTFPALRYKDTEIVEVENVQRKKLKKHRDL